MTAHITRHYILSYRMYLNKDFGNLNVDKRRPFPDYSEVIMSIFELYVMIYTYFNW